MGEAGAAFAVSNVDNTRENFFIVIYRLRNQVHRYFFELLHYSHFDRLNNNGSLGKELDK
jgi:hypothetical protein